MPSQGFRFKKIFPRDLIGPTVQRNVSTGLRIGMIKSVDAQAGTCTIKWLDRPGVRLDVILTQSSPGTWEIPVKDTVCLVMFDSSERARIIRYINLGHESRVKKVHSLPKLEPGDRLWEVGGSYIYMKKNGDITLSTLSQGFISLENKTGTVRSETVNWKVITEGGIGYFGVVKRYKASDSGNLRNELISTIDNKIYTEYTLKIVEFADGVLGITGIDKSLIDITLGTFVNTQGIVINKVGNPALSREREIGIKIRVGDNVDAIIDKEGRVTIKAKSLNINGGGVDNNEVWGEMISNGLETQDSDKGNRGEHVAREHDKITIPIGITYTDEEHKGLESKNESNLAILETLARAIISPSGPCSLNRALLPANLSLEGEITEGAENMFVGDD